VEEAAVGEMGEEHAEAVVALGHLMGDEEKPARPGAAFLLQGPEAQQAHHHVQPDQRQDHRAACTVARYARS
jgi:hypothetical protein